MSSAPWTQEGYAKPLMVTRHPEFAFNRSPLNLINKNWPISFRVHDFPGCTIFCVRFYRANIPPYEPIHHRTSSRPFRDHRYDHQQGPQHLLRCCRSRRAGRPSESLSRPGGGRADHPWHTTVEPDRETITIAGVQGHYHGTRTTRTRATP